MLAQRGRAAGAGELPASAGTRSLLKPSPADCPFLVSGALKYGLGDPNPSFVVHKATICKIPELADHAAVPRRSRYGQIRTRTWAKQGQQQLHTSYSF